MRKRLMVLAMVAILLAQVMSANVTAFDSPVSPISPVVYIYLPAILVDWAMPNPTPPCDAAADPDCVVEDTPGSIVVPANAIR